MEYTKPHRTFEDQVKILKERGLDITDESAAVRALRRIGYYRLSGYSYPLRSKGDTHSRSDQFVPGATFDDAVALSDFDDRLRATLLTGLQRLEIALRVEVGYQLGKSGPYAHLDRSKLDSKRCEVVSRNKTGDEVEAFDAWLQHYATQKNDAKSEDYVQHFIMKYDGNIPIWVATEFLTFGSLVSLFELLTNQDARAIARDFEIPQRDILRGWLRALNVLRNLCAHNARIWNRAIVYPPKRPHSDFLPDRIKHLTFADNTRLYYLAAILAHLLLVIDPDSRWPSDFKTTMKKYPSINGMTPENMMGFPENWRDLDLWKA